MRIKNIIGLLLISLLFAAFQSAAYDVEKSVSKLTGKNNGWEVIEKSVSETGTRYRLSNDYWLMFFLHWQPLTAEKENLNLDYVRNLLFNFWGPNMPFELAGQEGEMEIAGHKAYYVDATIYKGAVRTRFIVWNCPETKRQMIADTNINQRAGTPIELLKLQQDIANTVACHGQEAANINPLLTDKYVSEKYNLSFNIPSNWRTSDYLDKDWYPAGLNVTNGSLWTLPTDSQKFIQLEDFSCASELSKDLFREKYTKVMSGEMKTARAKYLIEDAFLGEIQEADNGFSSECSFNLHFKNEKYDIKMHYQCRAYLLKKDNKGLLIIAGIQMLKEFWGKPNDLTPSEKTFSAFIEEDIKPLLQD